MVGAGLLLRTLRDLLQENPGFNPTQVVTANVQLPNPNESQEDPYLDIPRRATFDRELLRRMKAIPGVKFAAITSALPTTNTNPNAVGGIAIEGFAIEDRPVESSQDLSAERIRISSDYFKVLQTTLLRGRSFNEGDENGKPLVAIIDESTARKYWPTRSRGAAECDSRETVPSHGRPSWVLLKISRVTVSTSMAFSSTFRPIKTTGSD